MPHGSNKPCPRYTRRRQSRTHPSHPSTALSLQTGVTHTSLDASPFTTPSVSNECGRFANLHRVIPWRGSHLTMPGSVGPPWGLIHTYLSRSQLLGTSLAYIAHQSSRRHLYPGTLSPSFRWYILTIFQVVHYPLPCPVQGMRILAFLACVQT